MSAGDDRWLLIAGNHREELRLYDRKRDRYERHNIAHRHPKKVRQIWGGSSTTRAAACPHPGGGRSEAAAEH